MFSIRSSSSCDGIFENVQNIGAVCRQRCSEHWSSMKTKMGNIDAETARHTHQSTVQTTQHRVVKVRAAVPEDLLLYFRFSAKTYFESSIRLMYDLSRVNKKYILDRKQRETPGKTQGNPIEISMV